jgi:hypothetical protein
MRIALVALVWLVAACKAPPPYVPPESRLVGVQVGMGEREVVHLLGRPDGVYNYTTPKVFIPFYLGADAGEMVYSYAGVGRVVFAAGPARPWPEVIRVEDDPSEHGRRAPRRPPPPQYDRGDQWQHDEQPPPDRDDGRHRDLENRWDEPLPPS